MLGVDAIHRAEVTHAREIYAGARNVIETPACRLENRREIPEDALCLGHNTPLDHLASGRVLADLTAEVEETTDFDEVIAVLLMANSCGYWVRWSEWWSQRLRALPMPCGRLQHP